MIWRHGLKAQHPEIARRNRHLLLSDQTVTAGINGFARQQPLISSVALLTTSGYVYD